MVKSILYEGTIVLGMGIDFGTKLKSHLHKFTVLVRHVQKGMT